MSSQQFNLDLDYADRRPGSDADYLLVEQAMHMLVIEHDAASAVRGIARAIDAFVAARDRRGEARARAKAAIIFRRTGDGERSLGEARQAIKHFRAHPDPVFEATTVLELGQLLLERDDLDDALKTFEDGLAALGEPRRGEAKELPKLRAFIQDCAADIHARRGEHAHAKSLRGPALAVFESLDLPHDAVTALTGLARDQILLGELEPARQTIERAVPWLGKLAGRYPQADAAFAHVSGLWFNERMRRRAAAPGDDAEERNAADLEESRMWHWRAISLFDQLRQAGNAAVACADLAEVEIEHGDADDAAHLLRLAGRRLGADPTGLTPAARATLGRINALRFEHFARENAGGGLGDVLELLSAPGGVTTMAESPEVPARARVTPAFANSDPSEVLPAAWARLDPERALLEAERQKSADLLALMRRHQGDPGAGSEAAMLEALARLGAEEDEGGAAPRALPVRPLRTRQLTEAFVDYYLSEGSALAFFELPGEKPRVYELEVTAREVADAVARLRVGFDGKGMRLGIVRNRPWGVKLDFVDELGRRLMPFLEDLGGANLVCFFPHGPLHNFPFHAVRDEGGRYLVERAAVAYGFSRRLLSVARAANASRPGEPVRPRTALVVSVPAVGERRPELFAGDAEFLQTLGLEVTALEEPAAATVENVLARFAASDLVHLNCHGLFSAEAPLDSALLMTDGREGPRRAHAADAADASKYLSARLLFAARAQTDTVVMRACSSGVTNVRAGDEQEGLLRALVHMGLSSCFVTRWKIDVESSRELIREMYRGWLGGGLPKAVALQEAQKRMLAHAEFEYYRHPYHWAPFILVGDWW